MNTSLRTSESPTHRLRDAPTNTGDALGAPASSAPAGWSIHRLTYREMRRRLVHMLPGCLAFVLHFVSHADPISVTMRWILVGCCAAIGLWILTSFRSIQRRGEGTGVAPVAGYSLSVLLTALLFPGHLEIALGVLAILAFGDGSATLFGLLFRGPRLPWNRAKSWSGLAAFLICGTLMAAWVYCGETHNPEALNAPVSFPLAVLIVFPAVAVSSLAESVRSPINDNIRVGITASLVLLASHFLIAVG